MTSYWGAIENNRTGWQPRGGVFLSCHLRSKPNLKNKNNARSLCWKRGRSSALPLTPAVNTPVRPASYCGRSAMIRQVDRRRYQIIMVINGDFTLKVGRGRSLLSKELFGSFEYLRTYISNKSPWRSNLQHYVIHVNSGCEH